MLQSSFLRKRHSTVRRVFFQDIKLSFPRISPALLLFLVVLLPLASCGTSGQGNGKQLNVVSSENFWGSIASQLGGTHVTVTSIINSPSGDPHDYESTTNDARTLAQADYVILNGAGYDDWASKLIAANPVSGRKVFTAANLLGKKAGDNPHLWYNPDYVERVADQITSDYKSLDSSDSSYFSQQRTAFENALKPYHKIINDIKTKFAHQKIGSSESIYVYQAQALNLDLITPQAYLDAENNGTDPPASAVAEFNQQIVHKEIKVMMLNVQNISNETRNLQQAIEQQHIPIVEITETIRPIGTKFQDWQVAQLQGLWNAFNSAASA
ncbi:MAG TPA: zinc ABC transporter substrate-binding protein [Ktedonobacteraceae bacterium]|jgi:zinc/manganese transport system substrate-binding protein